MGGKRRGRAWEGEAARGAREARSVTSDPETPTASIMPPVRGSYGLMARTLPVPPEGPRQLGCRNP